MFSILVLIGIDVADVLIPFENEVTKLRSRYKEAIYFFTDLKNREDNDEIMEKFEPVNIRDDFEYAFEMFPKHLMQFYQEKKQILI